MNSTLGRPFDMLNKFAKVSREYLNLSKAGSLVSSSKNHPRCHQTAPSVNGGFGSKLPDVAKWQWAHCTHGHKQVSEIPSGWFFKNFINRNTFSRMKLKFNCPGWKFYTSVTEFEKGHPTHPIPDDFPYNPCNQKLTFAWNVNTMVKPALRRLRNHLVQAK